MASIILLYTPKNIEIGIDFYSYTVSENFMGFKEIPSGNHYFYYNYLNYPRTSLFHSFKEKEVIIYKWDLEKEDFLLVESGDLFEETMKKYLKMEFIKNIAPFPSEEYKTWLSLSKYITESLLSDILPIGKKIFPERQDNTIFFTKIPTKPKDIYKLLQTKDPNPSDVTKLNFDKSELLECLLKDKKEEDFLGEFQFSFVIFLIGHEYRGFDQWKIMFHLVSNCESSLKKRKEFFIRIMTIVGYQLKVIPKDFFFDDLSSENFMFDCLKSIVDLTLNDEDQDLQKSGKNLKEFVEKTFQINLSEDGAVFIE